MQVKHNLTHYVSLIVLIVVTKMKITQETDAFHKVGVPYLGADLTLRI